MTKKELDNVFTYHAPTEGQVQDYNLIRSEGKRFASTISMICPTSRERSLALTKIREAVMWANAAIACNQEEK